MKTGSWQDGGQGTSGEDRQEGTDLSLQERWSNSQPETEGEREQGCGDGQLWDTVTD